MPNTPDLGLSHITSAQSGKEITANAAFDGLDLAISGTAPIDCTAGGSIATTALAADGYINWLHARLKLTGSPGAGFNLIVPLTNPKLYIIDNQSGQVATVKGATGTGVASSTGTIQFVYCDGTNVFAITSAIIGASLPYDMPFVFGTPGSAQIIEIVLVRAITIKAGCPLAQGFARVAFTNSAVWTIQKNGANLTGGTATFASSGSVATFALTSDTSGAAGDRIAMVAPVTLDPTGSGVTFTIAGLR